MKGFYGFNIASCSGDNVKIKPIDTKRKTNGTAALLKLRMPYKKLAGKNNIIAIPHITCPSLNAVTISQIHEMVDKIAIK